MRFKLGGPIGGDREIDFDEGSMLVKEARELQRVTGLGLRQFGEGMRDGNIDALMGMVYLALRREGVAIRWRELDDFNIADLEVITEDDAGEAAAVTGADPGDDVDDAPDLTRPARAGDVIELPSVELAAEVVAVEPGRNGNGVGPRPTPVDDPLKDVPVATP